MKAEEILLFLLFLWAVGVLLKPLFSLLQKEKNNTGCSSNCACTKTTIKQTSPTPSFNEKASHADTPKTP